MRTEKYFEKDCGGVWVGLHGLEHVNHFKYMYTR